MSLMSQTEIFHISVLENWKLEFIHPSEFGLRSTSAKQAKPAENGFGICYS